MKHANGKLDVCEIMRNLRTVIYYTCIISKIVKLILRARRLVTVTATVTLRLAVCKWR